MKSPRQLQRPYTLLVVLCLSPVAPAQNEALDQASLVDLIKNYYAAYTQKDLGALVRLWSERSPNLFAGIQEAQRTLVNDDYVFSNLAVSRTRVSANKAILQVTADAAITNIETKAVRQERLVRNFALIKDRAEWRVWREAPASEDLSAFFEKGSEWKVSADSIEQFAIELVKASDPDRERLLADNKKMVTSELVDALTRKVGPLQLPGSYDSAIGVLRLVQKIAEQLGDKARIASADREIGDAYREWGRTSEALKHYQNAVSQFEALGRRGSAAATLMSIGQLFFSQKNHKAAIESYEKALAEYEKLNSKRAIADALEEIASVYYDQETYDRALEYFQRCLKLREAFAGKAEIASTLNSVGNVYFQMHEYDEAIQRYQKALVLFEEVNDTDAVVSTMSNIASAHYSQGQYEAALDPYSKALKLQEGLRDKNVAANLRLAVARVFTAQGNYGPALEHLQKGFALFETLRNKDRMADALSEAGDIYNQLRNYAPALDHYQRSLKLYEDLRSLADSSMRLYSIGNVHFVTGAFDSAIESYQKALGQFEVIKHAPGVASMFASIGGVCYAQQKYDLAIEFYQKSLDRYDALGDKSRAAGVIERIASVRYSKGEYRVSLDLSGRAIELAEQHSITDTLWRARLTQGLAYRATGNIDQAKQSFEQSIAAIESMRQKLVHDEPDAQNFFQNKNAAYVAMMELLVDQNRVPEALAFAERVRANRLIDILQRAQITKSMTATEQEEERKLERAAAATKSQMNHERERKRRDLERYATLQLRLQKSLDDYRVFKSALYEAHPALKTLRGEYGQLKREDIAGILPNSTTALIEFVVADTKSYLFALSREPKRATRGRPQASTYTLNVYVISAGRAEMVDRVKKFREMIAQRDDNVHTCARETYELLFNSARQQLSSKTVWVIVPDDALWQLPFVALQTAENRYLVEDYAVTFAPSLTALSHMTRPRVGGRAPRTSLLAVGNPAISAQTVKQSKLLSGRDPLASSRESENEVKLLERLYTATRSRVYLGAAASEALVKKEGGKFDVIHMAAPALLSDATPLYSHVALSQSEENASDDGLLDARELMNLDLDADLTVLSSSESAKDSYANGDAICALAWSLFVAGCPASIVSRWSTNSPATTELMLELHRRLQTAHSRTSPSKAQHLQRAMVKLLRGTHQHPSYWSGFTLVGDFR